jgi:hypothetical protein
MAAALLEPATRRRGTAMPASADARQARVGGSRSVRQRGKPGCGESRMRRPLEDRRQNDTTPTVSGRRDRGSPRRFQSARGDS